MISLHLMLKTLSSGKLRNARCEILHLLNLLQTQPCTYISGFILWAIYISGRLPFCSCVSTKNISPSTLHRDIPIILFVALHELYVSLKNDDDHHLNLDTSTSTKQRKRAASRVTDFGWLFGMRGRDSLLRIGEEQRARLVDIEFGRKDALDRHSTVGVAHDTKCAIKG